MKKKILESECCFVCGKGNTAGLQLEFFHENGVVTSKYVPKIEHAGYENIIHGGIVAAILDEAMVWAPWSVTGKKCFTAEMMLRFIKPLKVGTNVDVTGQLIRSWGRMHYAEAEMKDEAGTVYATATGKYIEKN